MYGLSQQVASELCSIFESYDCIKKVSIFGSRAKGTHTKGSDIDLAIEGTSISQKTVNEILLKIEDLGLLYKVDIVNYHAVTDTPLMRHIDRVGKPFYVRR